MEKPTKPGLTNIEQQDTVLSDILEKLNADFFSIEDRSIRVPKKASKIAFKQLISKVNSVQSIDMVDLATVKTFLSDLPQIFEVAQEQFENAIMRFEANQNMLVDDLEKMKSYAEELEQYARGLEEVTQQARNEQKEALQKLREEEMLRKDAERGVKSQLYDEFNAKIFEKIIKEEVQKQIDTIRVEESKDKKRMR